MDAAPCEPLPWDSEFFACSIARVLGGRLDRGCLAAVEAWCRTEPIDCLYFLAVPGDPATAALAEGAGFRLVDLRVRLGRSLVGTDPRDPDSRIRPARADDVPELRRIAAVSHHDSRFYADPHFDRGRCDELYATWIEKSCREDTVFVAEHEHRPAGYISCVLHPETADVGEIGLLAVGAAAQGRGLGGALVGTALRWLASQGAARVHVVTQGRNTRAQRLYQAHGLLTESIGLWFHRWQDRPDRSWEIERE
ncbi:MAG TPA: GNAT family N-acetyltransferase [Thermoanaerobaculia bacterium]|jgi:dTDP-4-amino-4,6-dideoxy-D-galactose acyltransferase|nr:GNAT family N-acetyltransferase [Thermoanaerobaculia bacterium]